jgi:hypothetical protein
MPGMDLFCQSPSSVNSSWKPAARQLSFRVNKSPEVTPNMKILQQQILQKDAKINTLQRDLLREKTNVKKLKTQNERDRERHLRELQDAMAKSSDSTMSMKVLCVCLSVSINVV